MKHPAFLFLLAVLLLTSCNNEKAQDDISETSLQTQKDLNEVEVMVLERSAFKKEIISNGKLNALHKSALSFGIGEIIAAKNYKNGEYVQKGCIVASLNKEALQSRLKQVKLQFDKAKLELEDILIGQGYEISDIATMPSDLLHTAKLLSGFAAAQIEVTNVEQSILKSDLRAPFSGVLSGIKHNVYDRISSSEEYCTLISTSAFLLSFNVLESEISDIELGKNVKAATFSSGKFIYEGEIYEINPVVDEHGLIQVKALIESASDLMEGMNMKVRVQTMIPDKLIVPKSAVLIRQNKDVVFKYVNGSAIWTYVHKELENSTSYAIEFQANSIGSLQAGDTVITSGNLNLAHESKAQIKW